MELLRAAYYHHGQDDGEHTAFPTSQPASDHQGSYLGGHVPVILVLVPMVMVLANHGPGCDGGPGACGPGGPGCDGGPGACEDRVKKV